MVEMMLMQNAQMHQVMMQNMMLKALPAAALAQLGGGSSALLQPPQQVTTPQPQGHTRQWLIPLGGHKAWTEHTKSWESLRAAGDTAP